MPPPCQSGSRPPSKRPPPAVKEYAVTHLQSCFCPPLPTVAAAVARRHSPRSSSGLHLPFPAFAIAVAHRHSCRCQLSLVAVIRPPRSLCRRPPACIALFAPPHGIITTDIITISSSHPVRSCCSSRCPPPALAATPRCYFHRGCWRHLHCHSSCAASEGTSAACGLRLSRPTNRQQNPCCQ